MPKGDALEMDGTVIDTMRKLLSTLAVHVVAGGLPVSGLMLTAGPFVRQATDLVDALPRGTPRISRHALPKC